MIDTEDSAALAALNRHNDAGKAADDAAFEDAVKEPYRPSAKPVPMDPVASSVSSLDLENLFAHHPPKGDQPERYDRLRTAGLELAKLIVEITPRSPQQTLAIRAVKAATALANEAIAVNE